MVWVRPPWANQIPDGSYNFKVGKRKDVDLINVTCTQVGSLEATKFMKQWNEVPTSQLMYTALGKIIKKLVALVVTSTFK